MMGSIADILIAASPAAPMESLVRVRALAGRGIEGDRYFLGCGTFSPTPQKPDYEVTLIEQEAIDAFAENLGQPFTAKQARRNLVTAGLPLNELIGRELQIGSARIKPLRLCEPCNYLAKQTTPAVLRGLLHRGGLRAQILVDGEIAIGDEITVVTRESRRSAAAW